MEESARKLEQHGKLDIEGYSTIVFPFFSSYHRQPIVRKIKKKIMKNVLHKKYTNDLKMLYHKNIPHKSTTGKNGWSSLKDEMPGFFLLNLSRKC